MNNLDQTLTKRIIEYFSISKATMEDFSVEEINKYKEIKRIVKYYSINDRENAILVIDEMAQRIVIEKKMGHSNYMFFMLQKLRRIIKGSIRNSSSPKKISSQKTYNYFDIQKMPSDFKGIPSSPEEYIFLAKQSNYFQERNTIKLSFPSTIPILFHLNTRNLLIWKKDHIKFNLSTGHCLFGFSQNEDKSKALNIFARGGLLTSDLFIYNHVINFKKKFKKFIINTYVNLDTIYYANKLQPILPNSDYPSINDYIDRLTISQLEIIRQLLPDSMICREDDIVLRERYEKIIKEFGLLDFIINKVKWFRGIDLNKQDKFALSLSYVAATYLYSPLIFGIPSLSIESALNVEVPSQIALPFLESIGKENLFCFIGVLPLPDINMFNGSMTYGDALSGKIFVNDKLTVVTRKLQNFKRDWILPYKCWYVSYFLSKNNSIPDKLCEQTRCNIHLDALRNEAKIDISQQSLLRRKNMDK